MIILKIQFDRNLKEEEKKNPRKFKCGFKRQQRNLKRIDLMKKKSGLAFSTDQSGISENQEVSEGNCSKVKRVYKRINSHFESCVGRDKMVFFYVR